MLVATPALGRRRFVLAGAAALGGLVVPGRLRAQPLVRTPAQTEGPFYPVQFPADVDNDLVVVRGAEARAAGVVTHVVGRVLGTDGAPVANATVEIWQCDANGPCPRRGGAPDPICCLRVRGSVEGLDVPCSRPSCRRLGPCVLRCAGPRAGAVDRPPRPGRGNPAGADHRPAAATSAARRRGTRPCSDARPGSDNRRSGADARPRRSAA